MPGDLENAAKQAGELWDKLNLENKEPEVIAKAVIKEWSDSDHASEASIYCFTKMLQLVLGPSGKKAQFQNFVHTFGPIEKPNSDENVILDRLEKEFFDNSKKNIHSWFHGNSDQDSKKIVKDTKTHGSYLIRMGEDAGYLTLYRLSKKDDKMLLATSRLKNMGDGWYCQEKKKTFKSIAAYQEARGPSQGEQARLITVVPRKEAPTAGANKNGNPYTARMPEEKA
mmetsp:Transcript_26299/g.37461  ORF Transcript_26299/g.37461 Transcript_26299/m.37461 type:complete len:226 (-) Transcript_26299:184-861(-)